MIKTYNSNHTIAVRRSGGKPYKCPGMYEILDEVVKMKYYETWDVAVKATEQREAEQLAETERYLDNTLMKE